MTVSKLCNKVNYITPYLGIIFYGFIGLICLGIFVSFKYSLKQLILIIICVTCLIITYLIIDDSTILVLFLLLLAAKGIEVDKIDKAPGTSPAIDNYIGGVARTSKCMVIILDILKVFSIQEQLALDSLA